MTSALQLAIAVTVVILGWGFPSDSVKRLPAVEKQNRVPGSYEDAPKCNESGDRGYTDGEGDIVMLDYDYDSQEDPP